MEIGADTKGLKRGLVEAKGGLESLKRSTDAWIAPLKSLTGVIANIGIVAGVAGAAIGALKAAWDMGQQGAEIEYTATRFDRLAVSIGTTADVLMRDLKTATRGMYSDAELMASAADLMALGLAKTHDEAIRLARVAGGLNMNMNQLVLTLTNQTTMRFDALGVSVDGFEQKVKKLKDAGMDANAAFKEAFLVQAEQQLERVGERADSTAGSFDRLKAAWKNYTDGIKRDLAGPVGKVAGALADGMEASQRFADIQDRLLAAVEAGALTMEDYTAKINYARASQEAYADTLEFVTSLMAVYDERQSILTREVDKGSNVFGLATIRMMDYAGATGQAARSADSAATSIGKLIDQTNRDVGSAIGDMLKDLEWVMAGGGEIEAAFEQVKKGMESGAIDKDEGKKMLEGLFLATQDLGLELNEIDTKEAATNIEENLNVKLGEAWKIVQDLKRNTHFTYYVDMVWRTLGAGNAAPGVMPGVEPPHASGGPVVSGRAYPVGERGPELFVPNTAGRIVPNNQLGGAGGSTTIIQHFHNQAAAALGMAQVATLRRARLNASM